MTPLPEDCNDNRNDILNLRSVITVRPQSVMTIVMVITQLQGGIVITVKPPDGNDNGNYTIIRIV